MQSPGGQLWGVWRALRTTHKRHWGQVRGTWRAQGAATRGRFDARSVWCGTFWFLRLAAILTTPNAQNLQGREGPTFWARVPDVPCRGGGGVNPTSMAQNDTHVALIILTTQMWWWGDQPCIRRGGGGGGGGLEGGGGRGVWLGCRRWQWHPKKRKSVGHHHQQKNALRWGLNQLPVNLQRTVLPLTYHTELLTSCIPRFIA